MKYLLYLSLLVVGCFEENGIKNTTASAYNYAVRLGYKPVAAICTRLHSSWDKCAVNVGTQYPIIIECSIYNSTCVISNNK
jgi:hypothetical protein